MSCPSRPITYAELWELLLDVLLPLQLDEGLREAARQVVEEEAALVRRMEANRLQQIEQTERRIKGLQDKLLKASHAYLDEIFSREEYASAKEQMKDEITDLTHSIEQSQPVTALPLSDVQSVFELLDSATELYSAADSELKAELLRCVASNCVVTRENIDPVYREPFRSLKGIEGSDDWWR